MIHFLIVILINLNAKTVSVEVRPFKTLKACEVAEAKLHDVDVPTGVQLTTECQSKPAVK